ncbi:hypothetical protein F66182_3414 [Fusarium sp. NRRL 66182]|nr:hypothetical protein F66182_3414 [Fusarium sp. NRRL 66182]
MHFPVATSLAVLAAVSRAAAWSLTTYNNVADCNANDQTEYRALEGGGFECFTFGRDLPGVSCKHFIRGGAENGGCFGYLYAQGFLVGQNTICELYAEEDCRGDLRTASTASNLVCLNSDGVVNGRGTFASFKCRDSSFSTTTI